MSDTKETTEANDVKDVNVITPEWADRNRWELEQRVKLRQEFEQSFEIWKTKEFASLKADQDVIIKKGLEELYAKYKEEQKPPTPEEITELLNQDYETFPVKVQVENNKEDGPEYTTELFTIRELPQSAEIRFYKLFQDKIINKAADLQAFTQEGIDMPFETKVKSILNVIGESFDIMAETALIALNPFGKRKIRGIDIDREWVQNNISSNRQWSIIEAQLKVNRVKDFFSRVSASGQQTQMMMTGVNFQQLQRLAR